MKKLSTLLAFFVLFLAANSRAANLITGHQIATEPYLASHGGSGADLPWTLQVWDQFNTQLFSASWANGQIGSGSATAGYTIIADGSGHTSWGSSSAAPRTPVPAILTAEGVATTGNLSSTSVCVSSVASTAYIFSGAGVIDNTQPAAIQNATYVVGIPGTCSSGQIQLSLAPTPTNTGDTLEFTETETGNLAATSQCVSALSSTAQIAVGMAVTDSTNPSAIPGSTTVSAIPGSCSAGQVEMSAGAVTTETADTIVFTATTTGNLTASACVGSPGSTSEVLAGQDVVDVTNPGSIPGGTTVAGVPGTCSAGQVQLSQAATPSISGQSLTFGAQTSYTGTITSGSSCLSSLSGLSGIVVGAPIFDLSTGANLPSNTLVVAIPGTCSSGQIQISTSPTVNSTDTLEFGGAYRPPGGVTYIRIPAMVGGGGGGGTFGSAPGGTGGTGGSTTFGSAICSGGSGGAIGAPGMGGSCSFGSDVQCRRSTYGSSSSGGSQSNSVTAGGTAGASSPLGGNGAGGFWNGGGTTAATSAQADSGSGGGGAPGVGASETGSGGGSGGFMSDCVIASPASIYPWSVGSGGTSGGSQAGNGGSGSIQVDAF